MTAFRMAAWLILLVGCTPTGTDTGADTDADTDAISVLDGDIPPLAAVNSATIRSGGVDTTFACETAASGFYVVDASDPNDPELQALALYCAADDSDPDEIAAFRFTDLGYFGVGTFDGGAADEGEQAGRTLQVSRVTNGVTWIGADPFSHVLTIDALGAPGEHATGTFQASWDQVQSDAGGTFGVVDQPGALSLAFDYVLD